MKQWKDTESSQLWLFNKELNWIEWLPHCEPAPHPILLCRVVGQVGGVKLAAVPASQKCCIPIGRCKKNATLSLVSHKNAAPPLVVVNKCHPVIG